MVTRLRLCWSGSRLVAVACRQLTGWPWAKFTASPADTATMIVLMMPLHHNLTSKSGFITLESKQNYPQERNQKCP